MLDGFYRLIRGKSADFQINSRPVDRLMVEAVDVNRSAKTGKESGRPFNPDRMADITAGVRSLHMNQEILQAGSGYPETWFPDRQY